MRTRIHLVRHADVENPGRIWYGRLEGFPLSERGREQAEALGGHFAGAPLVAVYSSPLSRAMETAEAIASPHGVAVKEEPDIIESESILEGKPGNLKLLRNPFRLRYFLNPLRPSWGEAYTSIRQRMRRALDAMVERHAGGEVVAVSHMTPIQVARLHYEDDLRPAWRAGGPCARASVSTLVFDGDRFERSDYLEIG